MITVRSSEARRHVCNTGQETWKSFDPENPADPLQLGFRTLESFNEEGLAPGASFQLHPGKDLEILTYVSSGAVIQEDSSGVTSVLETGECGRSSAPRGTSHRTINGSLTDQAHAFQCCITPDRNDGKLRAEKRRFPLAERKGLLRLIGSSDGRNASLQLRQDVRMYSSILDPGQHLIHELTSGRVAWLHVVKGRILLVDQPLRAGDGASLVGEAAVSLTAQEPSEILLFDLP
jgi:redox-sensitive bicupin YhaK (pirin superfamily)